MLAISAEENKEKTLKTYVSDFDYKGQGANTSIRGRCFDLMEDDQAISKFQKYILFIAARNDIIREHDVAESLGFEEHRIVRLSGKSKPNHP